MAKDKHQEPDVQADDASTADAQAQTDVQETQLDTSVAAGVTDDPAPVEDTTDASPDREPQTESVELDDRTVRDTETALRAAPVREVAVDAQGVNRIVRTASAPYPAPQVDPDPREVARLEALNARLEARTAGGA